MSSNTKGYEYGNKVTLWKTWCVVQGTSLFQIII